MVLVVGVVLVGAMLVVKVVAMLPCNLGPGPRSLLACTVWRGWGWRLAAMHAGNMAGGTTCCAGGKCGSNVVMIALQLSVGH